MRVPDASQTILIENKLALQKWIDTWLPQLGLSTIVALDGALGAGKTQFCQWVTQALGCSELGSSPTFAIHHNYTGGRIAVEHIDLYRTESDDELHATGFWDLFTGHKLMLVEWASRVAISDWPWDWELWTIRIEMGAGEQRTLIIQRWPQVMPPLDHE
jgi:tRNA threonylcarbamoyladenosine biosynthesis protein TsaE